VEGTHVLESADMRTWKDTEGNKPREHSRTGERKQRVESGLGKKPSERGTHSRTAECKGGQLRTRKQTKRTRGTHRLESVEERKSQDRENNERGKGTHVLESAERGMSQDMERDQASKGHSLSGQCRQRDNSRQGK
jgi:hypothetical protein